MTKNNKNNKKNRNYKNATNKKNSINKKNNKKKKRIHRSELQETTKHSDKLIYDAELGIDMNTLLEQNLTIADLEDFSINEPCNLNKLEPSAKIFIPISDFLTSDACSKLFPDDSGISEVACTSTEVETTTNIFETSLDFDPEATKESTLELITEDSTLDIINIQEPFVNESLKDSSLEISKDNTVIAFPVDNTILFEREAERKKNDLNKYLEEEAKFKEFDKKLITLTREKLGQKKQSNFSKFLNKLFI